MEPHYCMVAQPDHVTFDPSQTPWISVRQFGEDRSGQGQIIELEERHLLKGGVRGDARTGSISSMSKIAQFVATAQGISDLDVYKRRFHSLSEGSLQGVIIHRHFNPLFVNARGAKMHGYTVDEILQLDSILQLIVPAYHEQHTSATHACMNRTLASAAQQFEGLRKDGSSFWVENLVTLTDWGGELAIQSAMVDITEQKNAEQQLRQREREICQMSRVKATGQMVAGIAHEINQPFYAIMNYAQAALNYLNKKNTPDVEAARNCMDDIAAEANRGGEIVNGFRRFVCKSDPRRSIVSVRQFIDETMKLIEVESRRAEVEITSDNHNQDVRVNVDRIQIEQVLVNLLQNAFDAMKNNPRGKKLVSIKTSVDSKLLIVSVTDTGKGLPDDNLNIFDAFVSTKDHGMGMGLAISKTIIDAHGGSICATQNAIGGATVEFTLPIYDA